MENEAAQQPQSPAASPVMSRRAREANPFRAMVFGEQADKMIAQGTSVIKLSLGEPDFGAPPAVRDAMREQYDGRALPYTAAMGLPELRQAIADFYRERHDLDIDPKRICVTAGGSAALLLATALTVDPGDDVIVADPSCPCRRRIRTPCALRTTAGRPAPRRCRAHGASYKRLTLPAQVSQTAIRSGREPIQRFS